MFQRSAFDERVKEIVCNVYPQVRHHIVEAETYGKIAHWRVWVESVRTGLDDFAAGLRLQYDGHTDEAMAKMNEAEWHLWTGAYEAWIRTAAIKTRALHGLLRSKLRSNPAEAVEAWKKAQDALIRARTQVPNHDPAAVIIAREAALHAIRGVEIMASKPRLRPFAMGLAVTFSAAVAGALMAVYQPNPWLAIMSAALGGLGASLIVAWRNHERDWSAPT